MAAQNLTNSPVSAMRYYLEELWGIKKYQFVPNPDPLGYPTLIGVQFEKDGDVYFSRFNFESQTFEKPQIAIGKTDE